MVAQQRNNRRQEANKEQDHFDTRLIKVRRVSRMYHGGRRMRFSATVVVGDKAGMVGIAAAKGQDVGSAQRKASGKAKKNLVMVSLKGTSIPHEIEYKFKSSRVLLMPAAPGTGIVAGATVKAVVEAAGVKDVLTKVFGSRNPINTAHATYEALRELKAQR